MKKRRATIVLCTGLITSCTQAKISFFSNFKETVSNLFHSKNSFVSGENSCFHYKFDFVKTIFKDNGWCKTPKVIYYKPQTTVFKKIYSKASVQFSNITSNSNLIILKWCYLKMMSESIKKHYAYSHFKDSYVSEPRD